MSHITSAAIYARMAAIPALAVQGTPCTRPHGIHRRTDDIPLGSRPQGFAGFGWFRIRRIRSTNTNVRIPLGRL